jgi:hypothetical protein
LLFAAVIGIGSHLTLMTIQKGARVLLNFFSSCVRVQHFINPRRLVMINSTPQHVCAADQDQLSRSPMDGRILALVISTT